MSNAQAMVQHGIQGQAEADDVNSTPTWILSTAKYSNSLMQTEDYFGRKNARMMERSRPA